MEQGVVKDVNRWELCCQIGLESTELTLDTLLTMGFWVFKMLKHMRLSKRGYRCGVSKHSGLEAPSKEHLLLAVRHSSGYVAGSNTFSSSPSWLWLTRGSDVPWYPKTSPSVFSALVPTSNRLSQCFSFLKDKEIVYSSVVPIRTVWADPWYWAIL